MPIVSTIGAASSRGFGEFRRAASGSAFPTYWVSKTDFTSSGSRIRFYRGNDLTNLLSNSPSGIAPAQPASGPTALSIFNANRVGVLLANGNTAFSDYFSYTTNNGTSWTNSGRPSNQQKAIEPAYGLNGMFAYRPSSNSIIGFSSQPDTKAGILAVDIFLLSALTGAFQSSGSWTGGSSAATATQVLYAPNFDNYIIFANANNDASTQAVAYNGSFTSQLFNTSGTIDGRAFRAGVSAAGNVMVFWYTGTTTRELREYTNGNFTGSSYISHGTVTGAFSGNRYSTLVYLPVNQKYVMATKTGAAQVGFAYSSASTPAAFSTTTVNLTGLDATVSDVHGFTFFEDTNGDIYMNIMTTASAAGDGGRLSLTYKSTDGGVSFSSAMSGSYLGALCIARNLQ